MVIKQIKRNKDDGSVEVAMVLDEEQTKFLLNFAIGILVQNGIATVIEHDDAAEAQSQPAVAPEQLN